MSEEKGKTQKEFEGFVGTALRGPKMGIYQNLLAGLLIHASTVSDPLKKIQNICEAAYLCKKKKGIDMGFVEVASTTCVSLLNTEISQKSGEAVEIAWAFNQTEENWEKYVKPWQESKISFYPLETSHCQSEHPEVRYVCSDRYFGLEVERARNFLDQTHIEVAEAIGKMKPYKAFFNKAGALTKKAFFSLKGEFSRWALIQLLPIQTKIADQIDPRVYSEVAALMMGRREEEEEQIESSVDQRQRSDKV